VLGQALVQIVCLVFKRNDIVWRSMDNWQTANVSNEIEGWRIVELLFPAGALFFGKEVPNSMHSMKREKAVGRA
jgi:hypothetical protein